MSDHHDHNHDHDDHKQGLLRTLLGGHHHHHSPIGGGDQASRMLWRAMLITFIFMLIEAIGGYYANSLALISDAAHMLTDIGAMGLSLFAIWIARRPSTPTMSFGYQRVEILGALISGLAIWFIAGVLVYEAILRMQSPPAVNGFVVFIVATIGLAANILSMKMLVSTKDANINVRAAYLHLFADSLGSVGAIIAGAILWATKWRPIDPIITIVFAALMLVSSWSLVKEAVAVLLNSTPTGVDPLKIRGALEKIPGVRELHDLHVWSVSSGRLALSVHLIAHHSSEDVLNLANNLLKESYGIVHTTIQVEHPDRFRSERCFDCSSSTK